MNGMKAGTMVAIAALLGVSAPLRASDQVVPGTRLSLKASNGKEKLSFKSKGTFTLPSAGGPDDPVNAGATFQIMNPGTGDPSPSTSRRRTGRRRPRERSSSIATARSPRAAR